MKVPRTFLYLLLLAPLLASCLVVNPERESRRGPGWYTVKQTDTLYSIAWRYNLDYQELARWNGLDADQAIYPGQRLRLLAPRPGTVARAAPPPAKSAATAPATPAPAGASVPAASGVKATPVDDYEGRDPRAWLWPTAGKTLNTFSASALDRRGIDIAGKRGQPVVAVADGKVVYSGNGLAGYGNLVIIKHSDTYLSAYAYCHQRLVQEGTLVKAGKVVATMGTRDNTAKLYFEIRRDGKPVDPLKLLPAR